MTQRRKTRSFAPPPGARETFEIVDVGPPLTPEQYREYCESKGIPAVDRPLIPTAEEIAKLPALARAAFATRCAARVAPIATKPTPTALDPQTAASLILAAAKVETPVRRLLRCIRRDFDRLVYLSKQRKWTDDTPVPQSVFGPMWPKDFVPSWAAM